MIERTMHGNLTVVVELLLVAAAVGLAAKRLRIHYNIALVLAGVGLGASQLVPHVALDPDVVLRVLLPILLFEAALATDLGRLRENLLPVVLLAVPGMLATVFVTGLVVRGGLGLDWGLALLLGCILAATDTIAVIAGFRKVRVPPRLSTIVENESLFNDGTALVAFTAVLAVIARGRFDPVGGVVELVWVTAAGLAIGFAAGYAAAQLMRRIDDHLMEIMLTVIVTYVSSSTAEVAGASPILAVVAAGITVRAVGWEGVTPSGKVAIRSVWEVAAFGVNSIVFLLVGLQINFGSLVAAAPAIGWGLLALTLGRAAAVYPFLSALRLRGTFIPVAWQHLMVWGNLKGSLSMALALSLPEWLPERPLLRAVVFGCALVTLTMQGLTLAPVARALGVAGSSEARRLEEEQGRLLAARAAQSELDRLQRLGLVPLGVFQRMRAGYQGVIARSERQLQDLLVAHSGEERRQTRAVRRRLLAVEKSAIQDAIGSGILSDEGGAALTTRIDESLAELSASEEREG
jgi:CPA1 family monovalent cation:H+ antiporter